ncbi:MAG: glycoside hydrolase family 2 protein [Bacteroides sp.]|nr:glycoside hydrolase family 2 protein [Bacteroides sp.]
MNLISQLRLPLISAFCLATCLSARGDAKLRNDNGVRTFVPMNFGWQFSYGEELPKDTDQWIDVNLPHDFQIHQEWVEPSPDERPDDNNPMANIRSRLSSRGFKEMGAGWYRKTFTPESAWKDKRVLLDFEGIMLVGDVYLNGERIDGTDYGYLGFDTDISDKLKYGELNVIEVKADTGTPDNSRWYTGGGLYRDVNIIVTDPMHYFTRHTLKITTPIATPEKSVMIIDGEIATYLKADSLNVKVRVVDQKGNEVYSNLKKLRNNQKQKIREFRIDSVGLDNVLLWDTENPNLYTAEVSLIDNDGNVYDRVRERFGFRTIEFSPEFGMKLNGKKVLLKGIANHHTLGALGAAAYPKAIEKRIKMLKDFGFNHIRSSHNPYSESMLDLCDENGILVVDELYDKWTTNYAGGRRDWNELWLENVPEWTRRDRNHPSIVFWSLGNELQLIPDLPYNDWGVTPYKLQKALLNRYDTTRPVTVAMHPRGRNEFTDSLPAPLVMETDIAAYNYRYMYFPGDSRRFPWMMFYQSEANTSNMGPNFFEMDLDKVIGLAYWGMIDYLGESKGWPVKGWNEGVFDISLEPKPNAYFLKSYFKPEEPVVRIAVIDGENSVMWNDVLIGGKTQSSHWNRKPGSSLELYTYTNADEVELILNGKSLGRRLNNIANPKERNRIKWDNVPYEKGYLEAVAYNSGNNKPVSRHRIETSDNAVRLTAQGDNAEWKADGMDLQHVVIKALDSKGRRDFGARQPLKFKVDGPAEIVGVINGDLNSEELTVGDSRRLFNGSAVVILRSKQNGGTVTLNVTSDQLKPVTLKFETK